MLLAQAAEEGSAVVGALLFFGFLALVVCLVYWLVQRVTKGRCPHCRRPVKVRATRCHHCHAEIAR